MPYKKQSSSDKVKSLKSKAAQRDISKKRAAVASAKADRSIYSKDSKKKAAELKSKVDETKKKRDRLRRRMILETQNEGIKKSRKDIDRLIKPLGVAENMVKGAIAGLSLIGGGGAAATKAGQAGIKGFKAGKKAVQKALSGKGKSKPQNAVRKPRVGEATTKTKAAGKNLPVKRKMMGKSNQNPPKLGSNKKTSKSNLPVKRKNNLGVPPSKRGRGGIGGATKKKKK